MFFKECAVALNISGPLQGRIRRKGNVSSILGRKSEKKERRDSFSTNYVPT